jgi:hypothetical protein
MAGAPNGSLSMRDQLMSAWDSSARGWQPPVFC